jgi:hypothetical protein
MVVIGSVKAPEEKSNFTPSGFGFNLFVYSIIISPLRG